MTELNIGEGYVHTSTCSSIIIEGIPDTAVTHIGTNGVIAHLLTLISLLCTLINICEREQATEKGTNES